MICFLTLFLLAETALELPRLGYLPSEDGTLRPLYGMRGNFVLGDRLPEGTKPEPIAKKAARTVVKEDGRHWIVEVNSKTERIRTALPPGRLYAIDSEDRLWWADEKRISCGVREWVAPATVWAFVMLRDGWMAVRTAEGDHAARCGDRDLYLLPRPE
ncbi:MAG: hypothetical protein JNL98_39330 [Bryobacterales bacterium]|nr:hypothetical protein [Bryobacterales bacterium]